MTKQVKSLGKILLDNSGITKWLGGETNTKDIKPIPIYTDKTSWDNFKADLDRIKKDPVQVDLYLKAHGLKQVEGLRNYILNNNIQQGSVNELIQRQNNKNIADQAHGLRGVNAAINEYNKLTKYASRTKLAETINNTNSSLGKYIIKLKGADASLFDYGVALVSAKIKTLALQAATMTLNAVLGYGIGLVVSGVITGISNLIHSAENAKKAAEGLNSSIKSMQSEFASNTTKIGELNSEYKKLSKGVSHLGENISLTSGEYDRYKDLVSQISDIMPNLTVRFNEQGEKIGFATGKPKNLNKEYKTYKKNEANKFLTEGNENGETLSDIIKNYNNQDKVGLLG